MSPSQQNYGPALGGEWDGQSWARAIGKNQPWEAHELVDFEL